MRTKIIEIRDSATFIAALCVDCNPSNEAEKANDRESALHRGGENLLHG